MRTPVFVILSLGCLTLAQDPLRFASQRFEVSVPEESGNFSEILNVGIDSKEPVHYGLSSLRDARSQEFFSIQKDTGVISTVSKLDREFMDTHYLQVTASSEDSSFTATSTIQVRVTDINDNVPKFERSLYNVSVHESTQIGTPLLSVKAIDADSGDNGRVSYRIRSSPANDNMFSIDSSNGVLSLQNKLDREALDKHTITVIAMDNADPINRKSSTAEIVINVIDDNDNHPMFEKFKYVFDVVENLSAKDRPTVGKVKALDRDLGNNADLRYSIIGGNNDKSFSIESKSGELILEKGLDREAKTQYTLIVRASDLGNPPRSNTTEVIVNVLDFNDNAPQFPNAKYVQSISENVPPGYSILQVKAFDPDEGSNGQLRYKIIAREEDEGRIPFDVEDDGWILTTKDLDRETKHSFNFQVEALDSGAPTLYSRVQVEVNILDANDNDPVFERKDYSVSVSELEPLGTNILTVVANDDDEDALLRYEIVGGNSRNRFTISSVNGQGVISIAQPLSYRNENNFLLTINAVDEDGRFGSCSVVISVIDANDHSPRFENTPYFADVFEDVGIGHTVLILYASDEDAGENARIRYRLMHRSDTFEVDPESGGLTVIKSLDRESVSTYVLTVVAEDGGIPKLSDTTEVEISVLDVNDNAPQFSRSSYDGSLRETAPVGTKVVRVSAEDLDERDNGKVYFELDEQSQGAFVIDRVSGDIRSNVILDRESTSVYEFQVIAKDGGSPQKINRTNVRIEILDVNDNPPQFVRQNMTFVLDENSPPRTRIGKIEARDPDIGSNAEITFHLLNSSDSTYFSLGEFDESGGITLFSTREFDYEKDKRRYEITIRGESAPLRADAHIEILIRDVNDNVPQLKDFRILYNTKPGEKPYDSIGQVPASDADPTNDLTYNFTHGNGAGFLTLDPTTGSLSLSPLVESNVNLRGRFGVMVSDGQNDIRANLYLQINHITPRMLQHSVTVQIANVSETEFLDPFLSAFEEALSVTVPCDLEEIIVFGIKSSSSPKATNVTFSILKGEPNSENFVDPSLIKQKILLRQHLFENMLSLEILPFTDDICVKEPCLNFERCTTIPKFGSGSPITIETDSVTFKSVGTLLTYSCYCPKGFTGMTTRYTCDTKINLCYSNPCLNGGKCISSEESVICDCVDTGYSGKFCEIPSHIASNCTSTVSNEVSLSSPSSSSCRVCPDPNVPYSDEKCRLSARSFAGGAFAAFSELKQRVHLNISLEFATRSSKGLIFYNGRLNNENDFVALELRDKTLTFHYSTGTFRDSVGVKLDGKAYSDGEFHHVEVIYEEETVLLRVNHCDAKLALVDNPLVDSRWRCANFSDARQNKRSGCGSFLNQCTRFLDLTGPFMLGGAPREGKIVKDLFWDSYYLDGCIKNLAIDGIPVDMQGDMTFNNGSVAGCPEKANFCRSSPCENGGTCKNGWDSFRCECDPKYTGKNCMKEAKSVMSLDETSELVYQRNLVAISFPWSQSLSFKTTCRDCPLMNVILGPNDESKVSIDSSGAIHYSNGKMSLTLESSMVADGRWHNIEVKWMLDETWLNLDYNQLEETKRHLNSHGGDMVSKIIIGGKSGKNAFKGCIQDVQVGNDNDKSVKILSKQNVGKCDEDIRPEVQPRCIVGEKPDGSCLDFCELNLCEEKSKCLSDGYSYRCICEDPVAIKPYCKPKPPEVCPRHWWGSPVCGPCDCDSSNGFNETCDATNGKCVCKDLHYVQETERETVCLPCNCYNMGSLTKECDHATGQCQCRAGVIGRQCDRCANRFAELTPNGCQVVYRACPSEYLKGIWWERTPFDQSQKAECPDSAKGDVVRNCTQDGWEKPDFSDCTHKEFLSLSSTGARFESWVAMEKLVGVLDKHHRFEMKYRNDGVLTASHIIQILEKELPLEGFELAHRRDRDFIRNLLTSVSWFIETSPPNEQLMSVATLLSDYGQKVASSMEETFTNPFEVVTDHVIFGLDYIGNSEGVIVKRSLLDDSYFYSGNEVYIPKYNNYMRNPDSWNKAKIVTEDKKTEDTQIVQYTMIEPKNLSLSRSEVLIPRLRWKTDLSIFSHLVAFSEDVEDFEMESEEIENEATEYESKIIFRGTKQNGPNRLHCVIWDEQLTVWSSLICDTDDDYEEGDLNVKVTCTCYRSNAVYGVIEESMGHGRSFFNTNQQKLIFSIFGSLTVAILGVTLLYLFFCNRRDRNSVTIHGFITFLMLIFQLVFIVTLTLNESMVDNTYLCSAAGLVLHYTSLAFFAWAFISCFHIYRMMTELRNINSGKMTFYNLLGFGFTAVVVFLTIGVAGKNYIAPEFCWMSYRSSIIWGMIGPEAVFLALAIITTIMNIRTVFRVKTDIEDFAALRAIFFINIGIHPLLACVHVSALLLINSESRNTEGLTYFFIACSIVTAAYFLCTFVVCDILLLKKYYKKSGNDLSSIHQSTQNLNKSALSYRYRSSTGVGATGRIVSASGREHSRHPTHQKTHTAMGPPLHRTLSVASTTSQSTSHTYHHQPHHRSKLYHPGYSEDESESDVDQRSFELASSHSSDEDNEDFNNDPFATTGDAHNLSVRDYPKH